MSDATMQTDDNPVTVDPMAPGEPQTLDVPRAEPLRTSGDAILADDPLRALDGPADEPSFEDLVGDHGDDEAAPPAGMAVLDALSDAEPEAASASASYGFDKELAEGGKWFKWPKLGPNARVRLCKVGNKAWKALSDRARVRYGGEDGAIKPETMDKIIEPMMAKSIFTGMENVVVSVVAGKPAPPLPDTVENRLRLMEMFTPDLRNELFKAANNPRNFRDLSEEVLGN